MANDIRYALWAGDDLTLWEYRYDMRANRRQLFRWMGWFAMANAAVLGLVSLRYFSGFVAGDSALGWTYLVTVYFAHHVMLVVVPLFILVIPLVLIRPNRKWITLTAVTVFALLIAVVMLDSLLWSQSRFHLNTLTMKILGWQSWFFIAVIFLISLFFEFLLATRCWAWVETKPRRNGVMLGWITVFCMVVSQGIHAWADASYYVPVTSVGQQLPVYKGFTAKKQLSRWGLVDPKKSREREVARQLSQDLAGDLNSTANRVLNYPLNPLQCGQGSGLNILLIMADAMRSDRFGEQDSPRLHAHAAKRGQVFSQHFSGGNSSRMGVFSLFYGLPPGYWSSFESLQRSSVLIDELQRQDYQLGLFTSSTMVRPVALDRTAFARVRDLRLQTEPAGDPAWMRDQAMTAEWLTWLDRYVLKYKPASAFFGFLFYDSTNAIAFPRDYPSQFTAEGTGELAKKFADYRTSIHFVDSLIGSVLDDLKRRGLEDDTVVIITSDHGEEFDDSDAGLDDHGSGYTPYQLQVPMILSVPGRAPGVYSHRSSHYDLVPTLMQDVLGCSNPASDYSSGRNLFSERDWNWLLAGSYYNYAVLEPDQITVTYPNGSFEIRDWNYNIAPDPHIRGAVLESVIRENSRFYRQ